MSVILWHGVPGCGKSTAMRAAVHDAIRRRGVPVIVLDPGRVEQWRDVPHVDGLPAVHLEAWRRRAHVAIPATFDQAEVIAQALEKTGRSSGGFLLAVDELREYASGRAAGRELVLLARRHRHAAVDLYLGTQSIGDVNTDLLSAVDTIYTGRVTAPYSLEILQRRYGLDPARVSSLGRGEFLLSRVGFGEGE